MFNAIHKHKFFNKNKEKYDYETIFNTTQDALFLVEVYNDHKFIYNRLNKAHEETTGLTNLSVKGKTPYEIFGEELGYKIEASFDRCVRSKLPISYEETLNFPKGEKVCHTSLSPIMEKGKVVCLVGSRRDISRLKQSEEKIKRLTEEYKAVFNSTQDLLLLIKVESDGKFRYHMVNSAFEKMTGLESKEVCGKTPYDLYGEDAGTRLEAHCTRCLMTKKPVFFEQIISLPSGNIVFQSILSPIFESGEVTNIVVSSRDITEQKKAEEALLAEKELLSTTLRSITDGVITADTNGKIIMLNKAAEVLTGWSGEIAFDKPLVEVFNVTVGKENEKYKAFFDRVLQTGKVCEIDSGMVLKSKNGAEVVIGGSCSPIMDMSNTIKGIVLIFRDITEKKRAEEKITYLSLHDKLTGLYNRAYFEEEIKYLNNKGQMPVSIILGDINGLKLANDVFGHSEGDRLLQTIANILSKRTITGASVSMPEYQRICPGRRYIDSPLNNRILLRKIPYTLRKLN